MTPNDATKARNDHTSALLLAATLLAAGFAGCVGALADTATSMSMRDAAEERAHAWDANASLVAVAAGEHATRDLAGDEMAAYNASHGEVGDGHAPAWTYAYEARNRTLRVTVAANGTVVNATEGNDTGGVPITGWRVEAHEAVDVVRANTERWAESEPEVAFYGLWQDEPGEDPVWVLAVFGDEGGEIAVVNATTGAFLGMYGFPWTGGWGAGWGHWGAWEGSWYGSWNGSWGSSSSGADEPPEESGSFEDTLTAVDPKHEHTFEIEHAGHDALDLELELEDAVWNAVRAEVAGPDGREFALEASAAEPDDEATLAEPAAGTYTVTVTFEQGPMVLEEGLVQEYELAWCAPGEDGSYDYGYGSDDGSDDGGGGVC